LGRLRRGSGRGLGLRRRLGVHPGWACKAEKRRKNGYAYKTTGKFLKTHHFIMVNGVAALEQTAPPHFRRKQGRVQ
jgi:hypothetical protein